jgi:hypothetical protein
MENKPNETTKKLEELRKNSIKEAYNNTKKRNEEEPEPEKDGGKKEETSKKEEKKLDNDQKNDYIKDENKSKSDDESEVDEKDKELLEKQFKGDPLKAVKSWREANRAFMKVKNSAEEKEEYFNKLSSMVEENPLLGELIDRAEKQEDIESFLASKFQESGKTDKPRKESESKPNITNDFDGDVDEKTLIDSGYLDPSEREHITADDWNNKVRQASVRFMYNELPDRLAKKAAERYQKQIEELNAEKAAKAKEEKNVEIIEERWLDGIEQITQEFGFDFVNNEEHQELLKDIQRKTNGYRDPDNMSVIDKDAVYFATQKVLRERNLMDEYAQNNTQPEKRGNDLYEKNQMNINVRDKSRGNKPKTVADKLRNRHLETYERQMAKRVKTKNE